MQFREPGRDDDLPRNSCFGGQPLGALFVPRSSPAPLREEIMPKAQPKMSKVPCLERVCEAKATNSNNYMRVGERSLSSLGFIIPRYRPALQSLQKEDFKNDLNLVLS
jgi:hypothetical protein